MKKLYCNGKKDFCPHFDGENPTNCGDFGCVYFDGSGCEITEKEFTNYDRILNMSIDEMSEFLMDWFMRCSLGQAPLNVEEWLKSGAKMDGGKAE